MRLAPRPRSPPARPPGRGRDARLHCDGSWRAVQFPPGHLLPDGGSVQSEHPAGEAGPGAGAAGPGEARARAPSEGRGRRQPGLEEQGRPRALQPGGVEQAEAGLGRPGRGLQGRGPAGPAPRGHPAGGAAGLSGRRPGRGGPGPRSRHGAAGGVRVPGLPRQGLRGRERLRVRHRGEVRARPVCLPVPVHRGGAAVRAARVPAAAPALHPRRHQPVLPAVQGEEGLLRVPRQDLPDSGGVRGVPLREVPLRGQRGGAVLRVRVSPDRVRGPRVRARPVLPHLQKWSQLLCGDSCDPRRERGEDGRVHHLPLHLRRGHVAHREAGHLHAARVPADVAPGRGPRRPLPQRALLWRTRGLAPWAAPGAERTVDGEPWKTVGTFAFLGHSHCRRRKCVHFKAPPGTQGSRPLPE